MDQKTHVQTSREVGKTVPVARETETKHVPGDYADYQGSSSTLVGDTYSSRMSALEGALGNKDSVKG